MGKLHRMNVFDGDASVRSLADVILVVAECVTRYGKRKQSMP
jgi:hypothetical protein